MPRCDKHNCRYDKGVCPVCHRAACDERGNLRLRVRALEDQVTELTNELVKWKPTAVSIEEAPADIRVEEPPSPIVKVPRQSRRIAEAEDQAEWAHHNDQATISAD